MRYLLILACIFVAAGCTIEKPNTLGTGSFARSPEISRSLELRERNRISTPESSTIIYISSVSVHHTYNEASTIAWRDDAGHWRWSQASETSPGGLLQMERELLYFRERDMSPSESQALNRLIQSDGLYRGEVETTGKIGVGAPMHWMSVVSPYGQVTVNWSARLRGDVGEIADMLLGHPKASVFHPLSGQN